MQQHAAPTACTAADWHPPLPPDDVGLHRCVLDHQQPAPPPQQRLVQERQRPLPVHCDSLLCTGRHEIQRGRVGGRERWALLVAPADKHGGGRGGVGGNQVRRRCSPRPAEALCIGDRPDVPFSTLGSLGDNTKNTQPHTYSSMQQPLTRDKRHRVVIEKEGGQLSGAIHQGDRHPPSNDKQPEGFSLPPRRYGQQRHPSRRRSRKVGHREARQARRLLSIKGALGDCKQQQQHLLQHA